MIEKIVSVQVLDETANLAKVKEYRNNSMYVFDLYLDEEVLATDRCELVENAPFELTEEEINALQGVVSDGE